MLNVILLAGDNGIGKSTTALELVKYYNFIQYSFGTAPKVDYSNDPKVQENIKKEIRSAFDKIMPDKSIFEK
mgnify:CR=1 FL=1